MARGVERGKGPVGAKNATNGLGLSVWYGKPYPIAMKQKSSNGECKVTKKGTPINELPEEARRLLEKDYGLKHWKPRKKSSRAIDADVDWKAIERNVKDNGGEPTVKDNEYLNEEDSS